MTQNDHARQSYNHAVPGTPMTLPRGARLGPYEVVGLLGAGGMGEVYRARDIVLGRIVALKILPAMLSTDPERVVRFEREARTLAALNHPHIAQLYGVETGALVVPDRPGDQSEASVSCHALVMELVEGETVAERIARGAMPLDDALPIARQMADALEAAHEQGIIHRDLKPANVKVRPDGTVKVLDFGLAKAMDSSALGLSASHGSPLQDSPTFTSPAMTMRGAILGTAAYMAPEQAKGKDVDRRADIWAFGIVLYEMLTGRAPFVGDSAAETIGLLVTRDPDWSALPAATPPHVRALLRRCIERNTRTRLRDIGEARVALETTPAAAAVGETVAVADAQPVLWRALPWALTAIIALALFAVWSAPWRSEMVTTPLHLAVPIPRGVVEAGSIENLSLAISRDGQSVAYCARDAGVVRLYIRRLDRRDTLALPGTEGAQNPFFSPDGHWVGFFSGGKLRKVAVDGGSPTVLADALEDRSGVWLDDDSVVFAPSFVGPLMQVPAAGGVPRAVTTIDTARNERTHRWPAALPGGQWVLFTIGMVNRPNAYDDAEIGLVSMTSGERRTLFTGASSARFIPPDRLLLARGGTLLSVQMDVATGTTIGQPVRVLEGIAMETTSGGAHVVIADTGTVAYLSDVGSTSPDELVWIDRTGATTAVATDLGSIFMPRLSADGRRVLVGSGPAPASGRGDLWVIDLRSGASTRLTFNQASGFGTWTPDQRHIIYFSEDPQPSRVVIKAVDGAAPERALLVPGVPVVPTGFTPDGGALLLATFGTANSNVLSLPVNGDGKTSTVLGGSISHWGGTVSPDGRWLAYASSEVGAEEVFVQPYPPAGGRWQVSRGGGYAPHWSANGRELYFVSDGQMMVAAVDPSGRAFSAGVARRLFTMPAARFQTTDFRLYDVAPDGSKFLMTRTVGAQLERRNINIVLNGLPR